MTILSGYETRFKNEIMNTGAHNTIRDDYIINRGRDMHFMHHRFT